MTTSEFDSETVDGASIAGGSHNDEDDDLSMVPLQNSSRSVPIRGMPVLDCDIVTNCECFCRKCSNENSFSLPESRTVSSA